MWSRKYLFILIICLIILSIECFNKYSKEINEPYEKKHNEKQFRMQKINLVWEKALKKLSGQKLKDLKNDLYIQDKEEMSLKRAKSEGQDKDGLKEAQIRKSFNNILNKYHLSDLINDEDANFDNKETTNEKRLFRDKKLEKLWLKAESSGIPEVQLKILKEELQHHQEKIDEFHKLASLVDEKKINLKTLENNHGNSIDMLDSIEEHRKTVNEHERSLKEKHKELKNSYHHIRGKVSTSHNVFEESSVQSLWDEAQQANFSDEELRSLKEELLHYEKRLKKLNYFQEELSLKENYDGKKKTKVNFNDDKEQHPLKEKVKDLTRKADKLESSIKEQIKKKHLEL